MEVINGRNFLLAASDGSYSNVIQVIYNIFVCRQKHATTADDCTEVICMLFIFQ